MFEPLKRRVREMIREALQPAMLPPKRAEPFAQPPASIHRPSSEAAYLRTDFDKQLKRGQTAWLKEMAAFTNSFGCVLFPLMPMLAQRHLENCRVLPDRESVLRQMKVGGICAEVGVQTGEFSKSILGICRPSKLHLIDLDLQGFSIRELFLSEVDAGAVCLHEGDSSTILQGFPEGYFDFIYIDADHSYQGVKRDIQAATPKLTDSGFLIFNDYTYWSPAECKPYGVIHAVNELCLEQDWEAVYFSLAHYMYCDIVIRRRGEATYRRTPDSVMAKDHEPT